MAADEAWTVGRLLQWTTDYLKRHGAESCEIGRAVTAPRQAVLIEREGLIGEHGRFRRLTKRDRRVLSTPSA